MTDSREKPRDRQSERRTPMTAIIAVRLPSQQFDDVYRRAQQARCSMPELVRRVLRADDRRLDHS